MTDIKFAVYIFLLFIQTGGLEQGMM